MSPVSCRRHLNLNQRPTSDTKKMGYQHGICQYLFPITPIGHGYSCGLFVQQNPLRYAAILVDLSPRLGARMAIVLEVAARRGRFRQRVWILCVLAVA